MEAAAVGGAAVEAAAVEAAAAKSISLPPPSVPIYGNGADSASRGGNGASTRSPGSASWGGDEGPDQLQTPDDLGLGPLQSSQPILSHNIPSHPIPYHTIPEGPVGQPPAKRQMLLPHAEVPARDKRLAATNTWLDGKGLPRIGRSDLLPLPPCELPVWLNTAQRRLSMQARIVDYWAGGRLADEYIAAYLRNLGFSVTTDYAARQLGSSCGYIAARVAVCTGSRGSQWSDVNTSGAVDQVWISDGNQRLIAYYESLYQQAVTDETSPNETIRKNAPAKLARTAARLREFYDNTGPQRDRSTFLREYYYYYYYYYYGCCCCCCCYFLGPRRREGRRGRSSHRQTDQRS